MSPMPHANVTHRTGLPPVPTPTAGMIMSRPAIEKILFEGHVPLDGWVETLLDRIEARP